MVDLFFIFLSVFFHPPAAPLLTAILGRRPEGSLDKGEPRWRRRGGRSGGRGGWASFLSHNERVTPETENWGDGLFSPFKEHICEWVGSASEEQWKKETMREGGEVSNHVRSGNRVLLFCRGREVRDTEEPIIIEREEGTPSLYLQYMCRCCCCLLNKIFGRFLVALGQGRR